MKHLALFFALALALALSTSSPAAEKASAPRPNILFIIFDDWGWEHAGAYGCSWVKTPNFDRLAKEGVLFRSAFTSNPKCSPCRATILTGRNSWQLEEAVCHNGLFPKGYAVYPDLLEAGGYSVGLTGKGWGPGDYKTNGRTRNPAGPEFMGATQAAPAKGIGNTDYVANFERFLQQRDAAKPFSFWMGFSVPHRAYEPGSGLRAGKQLSDVVVPPYLPDNEVTRGDLLDYAVEVEWGDAQVGRALAALEKAGLAENTLVIVTSDHGMPFPRVKGQIYEDGFRLPLAMRWPQGIKPGRVVEDFVNVRDFAPTYLELAGLPKHEPMSGKSLVSLLSSPASGWVKALPASDFMLVGKERHDLGRPNDWGYPVRAIRTAEFFYSHNYHPERWPACNPETGFGNCDDGPTKSWLVENKGPFYELAFAYREEEELFSLKDDPKCVKNLAKDPAFAAVKTKLREQMEAELKREQDPRVLGKEAIFDTYKYTGSPKKSYAYWEMLQRGITPPEDPAPKKKGKGKKAAQ